MKFSINLPGKGFVSPKGGAPYVFETEDEAVRMAELCYGSQFVGSERRWELVQATTENSEK